MKDERGTVIYREYTNENGKTDSIPVTPGRYTFREVYAPEGFALNEAVMTFTVEQDGAVTGDTTIRDDYSRFAIEKHDEASHPLAGVTFSLVNESGNTVMTAVTDANGLAVLKKSPSERTALWKPRRCPDIRHRPWMFPSPLTARL